MLLMLLQLQHHRMQVNEGQSTYSRSMTLQDMCFAISKWIPIFNRLIAKCFEEVVESSYFSCISEIFTVFKVVQSFMRFKQFRNFK